MPTINAAPIMTAQCTRYGYGTVTHCSLHQGYPLLIPDSIDYPGPEPLLLEKKLDHLVLDESGKLYSGMDIKLHRNLVSKHYLLLGK